MRKLYLPHVYIHVDELRFNVRTENKWHTSSMQSAVCMQWMLITHMQHAMHGNWISCRRNQIKDSQLADNVCHKLSYTYTNAKKIEMPGRSKEGSIIQFPTVWCYLLIAYLDSGFSCGYILSHGCFVVIDYRFYAARRNFCGTSRMHSKCVHARICVICTKLSLLKVVCENVWSARRPVNSTHNSMQLGQYLKRQPLVGHDSLQRYN